MIKRVRNISCRIVKKRTVCWVVEFLIISLLTLIIEKLYLGVGLFDNAAPLNYLGDGFARLVSIKEILTNGDEMLGWPYHVSVYGYNAFYNLWYRLFVKICGIFTFNYYRILNYYIVLILYLNVVITFYVLRAMKVKRVIGYLASVCFGLSVYVQFRISCHYSLATVECVPIALLLVFWLMEDEDYCQLKKGFWGYRKNYIGMFFSLLIAYNGMIYYPFFTCYILGISFLIKWKKTGSFRSASAFLVQIGEIVIWIAISFIPTLVGAIKGFGNTSAHGAVRDASRVLQYGLDLKALFLLPDGYGKFNNFLKLSNIMKASNENAFSYLGVAGCLGLIILLLVLIVGTGNKTSEYLDKITVMSRNTVAIILLAVTGGAGVLIALVVPYITCYNRVLPYIHFMSILTLVLTVQYIEERINNKNKQVLVYVMACLLFVFTLYEQQGITFYSDEKKNKIESQTIEDREFFEQVQQEAGEDALVFSLPYMVNFENGPLYDMLDYDHLKGYLYTDSIRWSYGADRDTENDVWYRTTSQKNVYAVCEELVEKGFSGIYLNLNGYAEEKREQVLERFIMATNCGEQVIYDTKGLRVYLTLDNYIRRDASYIMVRQILFGFGCDKDEEVVAGLANKYEVDSSAFCEDIYSLLFENPVSDEEFVHLLYNGFLNRSETEEENDFYVKQLEDGKSRSELIQSFISSEEFAAMCGN